eukprot:7288450-Karenia_brevis.AAC.1
MVAPLDILAWWHYQWSVPLRQSPNFRNWAFLVNKVLKLISPLLATSVANESAPLGFNLVSFISKVVPGFWWGDDQLIFHYPGPR